MKCVNCGANVSGSKCEYCGTEYSHEKQIMANFSRNEYKGVIKLGDEEIPVYVESVESSPEIFSYKDNNGCLRTAMGRKNRKWVLCEV